MIDKASDAFRTISEVSAEVDVPPHVLRFWETKFSNLRPLKRSGGRRYYRPNDISTIVKIRDLLYKDGFTIKGAQRFLKSKEGVTELKVKPTDARYNNLSNLRTVQSHLENVRKKLAQIKRQLDS
jgi:DNA-binding transcriptional MerR regulator